MHFLGGQGCIYRPLPDYRHAISCEDSLVFKVDHLASSPDSADPPRAAMGVIRKKTATRGGEGGVKYVCDVCSADITSTVRQPYSFKSSRDLADSGELLVGPHTMSCLQ